MNEKGWFIFQRTKKPAFLRIRRRRSRAREEPSDDLDTHGLPLVLEGDTHLILDVKYFILWDIYLGLGELGELEIKEAPKITEREKDKLKLTWGDW